MPISDDCICTNYDGRGKSPCGYDCPAHPRTAKCSNCGTAVAEGRRCWPCESKWLNANRPPTVKELRSAYTRIIDTFHALESYLMFIDKYQDRDERNRPNAEIDPAEVRETIKVLRHHWEHKIIPWSLAEEHRLCWHEE